MDKIKWGIAGPGCIAEKFAKAIKNVDCAILQGVASRTFEKGKSFAEKYNIPNIYGSYEEMAKSDDIDAVYISTPHPFHKPCAEIFIKNGKHILCEKPLCVNAKQASEVLELSKKYGVFVMEAMWTRFLPAIKEVCKIVKNGEIGDVRSVKADFCYFSTPLEDAKIFENNMAGGSLLDVGVYCLHFASLFFGTNPELVYSASSIKNGIDETMDLLIKYSDEKIASLSSAVTLEKPDDAYIYGTKGYIHLPHFYGANEFYIHNGENIIHIEKTSIGDGFEEEILEACKCINEGKTQSDILPLSESIAVLKIMDEIRKEQKLKYPMDGEE